MKITDEVRKICALPDALIDPKAQAYIVAQMRLLSDALSIQALSGGAISPDRAHDMARAHLSDADRAVLAHTAEPVDRLMLPESSE